MTRPPALWEDTETAARIKRALPVSIGLHAMVLVVIAVQGLFFGTRAPAPPNYEVMLIGPIKKGTPGGPPAPPPRPAPPDKSSPIPAPNLPKADSQELVIPTGKDARSEALARAQREAALNRARELAARNAASSASANASPIPAASPPPAGNAGSGAPGTGDGGSEYGVEWSTLTGAATYEQQIQAIVNANWLPPTWVSDRQPLQCVIRVKIGFDGKIAGTKIEQTSGNAAFDASATVALKKSDPFPPPPIDLKPYLAKKGVPLRFDSRVRSASGSR